MGADYLKKYGILENSTRGIWSLKQKTNELNNFDPQKVVRFVRGLDKKEKRLRPMMGLSKRVPFQRRFLRNRNGNRNYTFF